MALPVLQPQVCLNTLGSCSWEKYCCVTKLLQIFLGFCWVQIGKHLRVLQVSLRKLLRDFPKACEDF